MADDEVKVVVVEVLSIVVFGVAMSEARLAV